MSFPYAVQSLVFYCLSCTPCTEARNKSKRRAQARRDSAEKASQPERPGVYKAGETNPAWQMEIALGPSLPKKTKSRASKSSQRKLTSAGADSSALSMSDYTAASADWESRTQFTDSASDLPDGRLDEIWNRRPGYQRPDEHVWGGPRRKLFDAIAKAKDSTGRFIESTLGTEDVVERNHRKMYQTPRNPPINDYHPPIVRSQPLHKDELKWMLQPPPPAKFMEGKVPFTRSMSCASLEALESIETKPTWEEKEEHTAKAERRERRREKRLERQARKKETLAPDVGDAWDTD